MKKEKQKLLKLIIMIAMVPFPPGYGHRAVTVIDDYNFIDPK